MKKVTMITCSILLLAGLVSCNGEAKLNRGSYDGAKVTLYYRKGFAEDQTQYRYETVIPLLSRELQDKAIAFDASARNQECEKSSLPEGEEYFRQYYFHMTQPGKKGFRTMIWNAETHQVILTDNVLQKAQADLCYVFTYTNISIPAATFLTNLDILIHESEVTLGSDPLP